MEQRFKVGVITATHGLKGEVKVFPTTDDAARFKKLKKVTVEQKGESRELEIGGVRFFKNMVILKFKGIDDIDQVRRYCKGELFVDRDQAVPLEADEYYIADLLDMRVVSDEGEELGQIADVLQTGANDVYVVRQAGQRDLLIPAIHDCILQVDVPGGEIRVHLLPGLREES